MSRLPRLSFALLILALVSASPGHAQARQGAPSRPVSVIEALERFLPDLLTRWWGGGPSRSTARPAGTATAGRPGSPTSIWADLGCSIDPYGRCVTTTQQVGVH